MNILIVGAGGGIGGALLQRLTRSEGACPVLATHHRPVSCAHPSVHWVQGDLTSPQSIRRAARDIACQAERLDLAIFASGLLHTTAAGPEKNLAQVDFEQLQRLCATNALGPIALLAQIAPALRRADRPRVVMLSAQVGSIGDNQLGGWYGYRMAKAALNMGVKCAAIEAARWRNDATIVALHPGTTRTNLSRPFIARRPVQPQNAQDAAQRIEAFTRRLHPGMNGGFYNCEGEALPW